MADNPDDTATNPNIGQTAPPDRVDRRAIDALVTICPHVVRMTSRRRSTASANEAPTSANTIRGAADASPIAPTIAGFRVVVQTK